MKFQHGDATDHGLCLALKHEFLRCDDAFSEFVSSATELITEGQTPRRSFKAYNAYARFIQHLYEFMIGAAKRELANTKLSDGYSDKYISSHTLRLLTNRREDILTGRSTNLENHISYYPKELPHGFAKEFREFRNTVSTHVTYERSSLSLTDFYRRNHKFLYMLYVDIKGWWGRQNAEFPDLNEITSFSVLLEDDPPVSMEANIHTDL